MDGHYQAQLGDSIYDASDANNFGSAMLLSRDGLAVDIAAFNNDEIDTDAGHVRVYGWDSSMWMQQGDDINGVSVGKPFVSSVFMSENGSKLAI